LSAIESFIGTRHKTANCREDVPEDSTF